MTSLITTWLCSGATPNSLPLIRLGQGVAVVDHERVREPRHVVVRHRLEVAERVRIRQLAVLAEALLQVAALHVVKAAGVAAVVAAEDAALGVDLDAERVAAPFGEDLVLLLLGVIPPDELAHASGPASCRPAG